MLIKGIDRCRIKQNSSGCPSQATPTGHIRHAEKPTTKGLCCNGRYKIEWNRQKRLIM